MTYNTAINITEEERLRISDLHDLTVLFESLTKKISEFRYTPDREYVIFEEQLYSTETGELHPLLLEKWSVSDILHTVGDVASVAVDFVIPGSGAIVDGVNAISYFIEALIVKDSSKKKKLVIMGLITLAFAIIPGPLQAIAIPMKRFVKYGAKKALNKSVMAGLKVISDNLGKILAAFPALVKKVANSGLGKKVFGDKLVLKISGKMDQMTRNITQSFNDLMVAAKKAEAPGIEDIDIRKAEANKIYNKRVRKVKRSGRPKIQPVRGVFRILSKLARGQLKTILEVGVPKGRLTWIALRKLGFGGGGKYKYIYPTGQSTKIRLVKRQGDGILIRDLKSRKTFIVKNHDFIFNAVAAPWLRRGKGKYVPLFIKRLTDLLTPEGQWNEEAFDSFPDLSIDDTSRASLAYLHDDLSTPPAGEQTKKALRTSSKIITDFQTALIALGYSLPKYGADGSMGSETKQALNQFQSDASLTGSHGRMDRLTAQKLSLELKARGIPKSERLQKTLNNI